MAPSTKRNDDWLASLARQAASSDTTGSSNKKKAHKKGGDGSNPSVRTKAERIQHRQEKKAMREEKKQRLHEEKQAKLAKKKSTKQKCDRELPVTSKHKTASIAKQKSLHKGMTPSSKNALVKLSTSIKSTVASIPQSKPRFKNQDLINGLPPPPKGKATKQSTINPNSVELQPRTRDYNGQGLARPSLYLPLNDATFIPRLEEEFAEHIPGFFGKAKTAAVKKQKEGEMLWRIRLEEKQKEESGGKKKKRKVDMI